MDKVDRQLVEAEATVEGSGVLKSFVPLIFVSEVSRLIIFKIFEVKERTNLYLLGIQGQQQKPSNSGGESDPSGSGGNFQPVRLFSTDEFFPRQHGK